MPMGNFKRDLKTGERGEAIVIDYLESLDSVARVEDVRDDVIFREFDVDFVIETTKGKYIPIEVKTDTQAHRTGNIAYEVHSSKTYQTKGCFEKTKAKYIYYYLVATEELFRIDVKRLRMHVERFYKGTRLISMGDDADGYLIKISELQTHKVAKKIL